ncbi:MAG: hypothetical protein Fur0018_16290 [Anaerolineales bacterium]
MIATSLLVLRVALSAALYAFLLGAFWVLWHGVSHPQNVYAQRSIPVITLRSENHEQRFVVPEVMIGRAMTCDCILDDNTVSAQHSLLVYKQSQWWLSDSGSTNGTFINETRVDSPTVLRSGDLIRCGQVTLQVEIETPAA